MKTRPVHMVLALGLFAGATHSSLHAQAWIPPKGEGSLNVGFAMASMGDHLFSSSIYGVGYTERSQDLGDSNSRSATLGFSLGVLDRFAVSADIAYVSARYQGAEPEGPADDGTWNNSIQDLRGFFRYQAYRSSAFVVTPLVGFVLPLANYDTTAHSSVGTHKWEIPVGVSLGAPFGKTRPLAYLVATGAYSFVEELHDISTNKTNATLEIGGFPHPSVTLRAYGAWQNTHGGIDWAEIQDDAMFMDHDAAADADYWGAGLGIAWSINRSFDLFAGYSKVLAGSNVTQLSAFNIGMSWNFGKGLTDRRKIGAREGPSAANRGGDDAAPTTAAIYAGLRGW